MKILHFSDPHAGGGAEDWMAYVDKRAVGVFNYTYRRRFKFDLARLERMVTAVVANPVDLVICTGDLTSTGQPGEFEKVRAILKPLRDSAMPIIYTPGNHDYYVKRPWCVAAMKEMVHYLSRGEYEFDDLPTVRSYGGCDFIILNTSRPSNLLCSWGFVSKGDSRSIEELCAGEKSRPRILVTHYPLSEEGCALFRLRHRLFGQKKIKKLVRAGAIDLALAGHVHRPLTEVDERGRGESISGSVTANGVASLIDYDPKKDIFSFSTMKV